MLRWWMTVPGRTLKHGKSSRKTFSLGHTKGQGASNGVSVGPGDQSDCGKSHHSSLIPWDRRLVHQDLLNTHNTHCHAPAQTAQHVSTFGNSDDVTMSEVLASSCKRTARPTATHAGQHPRGTGGRSSLSVA